MGRRHGRAKLRGGALALALGVLVCSLSGCGYAVVGAGRGATAMPVRLAVTPFTNQTREPAIDIHLTAALRQAMLRNQSFRLSTAAEADKVLYGTVRHLQVSPVSFDASDNVLQYRLEANVEIRLEDIASKTTTLEHVFPVWADYLVSSTGVVRENVVARETALTRLAEQFASECTALLTVMLL